ncbi:MAG: hypothetical protein GY799_30680 [Desulfobulbaceae bacterium]|nr:hypothetical protein [Desulfobulbaceae bacterium]
MNRIIIFCIVNALFISPVIACENRSSLVENIKADFIQFMAKDWGAYHVTEYFKSKATDYSYLGKTFRSSVVSELQSTISTNIQIKEESDTEGSYDLGIVRLEYPSEAVAEQNFDFIQNNQSKNLKGGKIFIGYTCKLCDKAILIIYSKAILTNEINAYFTHFNTSLCNVP